MLGGGLWQASLYLFAAFVQHGASHCGGRDTEGPQVGGQQRVPEETPACFA